MESFERDSTSNEDENQFENNDKGVLDRNESVQDPEDINLKDKWDKASIRFSVNKTPIIDCRADHLSLFAFKEERYWLFS